MKTVLLHWRVAYDDDDSLTFLEIAEGRDKFSNCHDYIRGFLEDHGTVFDPIKHEEVDPFYYIINVLDMPEGFDHTQVVWNDV